jgi:RNA polymerase-associated protein RTF1
VYSAGMGDHTESNAGKHTSVTKEASRAITDLKKQRKAKDERAQRRVGSNHDNSVPQSDCLQALRRENRPRSPSGSDSHSTEDGEIDPRLPPRPSRFQSPSSSSPLLQPKGSLRRTPSDVPKDSDIDTAPPTRIELMSARLTRYDIVDLMFKDGFEELAVGMFMTR